MKVLHIEFPVKRFFKSVKMHRREQRVTEVARHLFSALPTKLKAILIISNALQILNENK